MKRAKTIGSGIKDIKITISYIDDSGDTQNIMFEVDNYTINQRVGRFQVRDGDRIVKVRHNGQQTLEIKAWKGCRDYDSFVDVEEIYGI